MRFNDSMNVSSSHPILTGLLNEKGEMCYMWKIAYEVNEDDCRKA
jgi:hypothetical protein